MKTLLILTCLGLVSSASAGIVYSNDFETNTAGLTAGGTLTTLDRVTLPTDSTGPSSTHTSMWLGKLGYNVTKNPTTPEIVGLNLAGLSVGTSYFVNFDLLIGGSWDGSAGFFGPDSWKLTVNGTSLVDTTFSNGLAGVTVGAYSPQRYSDTTYTSTAGPDFTRFTGADQSFSQNAGGFYADDYAIYYFGHGAGNPILSFVAASSTANLEFSRYGAVDGPDEYWALDNLSVVSTGVTPPPLGAVPEPSTYALFGALALTALTVRRRLSRKE